MRRFLSATLLLAVAVWPCLAQNARPPETIHLAHECRQVSGEATVYLQEHGMAATEDHDLPGLSIGASAKPWLDAQRNKISDFRAYWSYANGKDTDKQALTSWHLRLSHYHPIGEMKLMPDEGGCKVDFRLRFYASGADMVALIIPLDSMWSYGSNGRLEREYLAGIAEELDDLRH